MFGALQVPTKTGCVCHIFRALTMAEMLEHCLPCIEHIDYHHLYYYCCCYYYYYFYKTVVRSRKVGLT